MSTSPVVRDVGMTDDPGGRLSQPSSDIPKEQPSKTLPTTNWINRSHETLAASELEHVGRTRPRVFPYSQTLPYDTETVERRTNDLDEMIRKLYIAVSAGDFNPGAIHWTREIRSWMALKFDLTRRQRNSLAKLYYDLSLAPGIDPQATERFAIVFMSLTKRKHYWRLGVDLVLDWRPLFKELKAFVLPESYAQTNLYNRRNVRTLVKLCTFAQHFFDPKDIPDLLETLLPYFSMSNAEQAFAVIGLLNLLFPATAPPADRPDLYPQQYLPTFFHLWSTVGSSQTVDHRFLDFISRIAFNSLCAEHLPWSEFGIFSEEQSAHIFTSILRIAEVPVGQASSPYSPTVDMHAGLSLLLDKDQRKHPTSNGIARFIVSSLSPACLSSKNSILHQLEALIQSVETFYHPSNYGSWAKGLALLTYHLGDCFVLRWNREHSGEYTTPADRRLNDDIKRRFVLCLREVTFMGIFAKSETAINYSLSTLQSLAYLEPKLILPGALQRIYPAMQGLVEVHRTVSSIRSLQMLSRIIARTKGFRCHLTTLLGLALPGIDANDLDKTTYSLSFIQAVCYNVPMYRLEPPAKQSAKADDDDDDALAPGTEIAVEWVTSQIDRFEREGVLVEVDYDKELSDEQEELILRSSTAGFREFLTTFIGRLFTLLQNLPDSARVRSGSPEEVIVNILPATFTPLLSTMSPELYDLTLEQIASFISDNVVHQARDAMAFICNALVKVNPKKALARLLPGFIANIRSEISENGAGSTRTVGAEILPRDRALVWNISLLSMCVVHVGADVLDFKQDLFDIALFMQEKCRGIPLVHVSNFIHHLLLNLTVTYTRDYALYDAQIVNGGLTAAHWGMIPDTKSLNIKWHVPTQSELDFAVELFQSQAGHAIKSLQALTSDASPVKRDGTGKEWSDETSRHLVLLRLIIAGCSCLFRSEDASATLSNTPDKATPNMIATDSDGMSVEDPDDADGIISWADEETVQHTFRYPTGYSLEIGSAQYKAVHELRQEAGQTLHRVHEYLIKHQEDDVPCFNSLYTAYRSWFIDIGIERSAHVLDRLTRLFAADIHPFKVSGMRKAYPRPLLVKRANLYHFQRLRHNESPRLPSELDKALLRDLAQSSVSTYTDIRRNAQSAGEAAVKCIVGGKPLIIPHLLDSLEAAVRDGAIPRIKGAMYSLLMGSLTKPLGRHWKYTPRLIKLFLQVSEVDRPSIQKLVSQSQYSLTEMCKASDQMVILDQESLKSAWPKDTTDAARSSVVATTIAAADKLVEPKQGKVHARSIAVEKRKSELAMELIELVKTSHWKKASRTALMVYSLDCRFDRIASHNVLELAVNGTIDQHPSLRQFYITGLLTIFNVIQIRSVVQHSYENYLLDKTSPPSLITVPTDAVDDEWTGKHLDGFAKPEAEYFVDTDYPGWLVWSKKGMHAFEADPDDMSFDVVEQGARSTIAKSMDRHWFSTFFAYMKQEPRSSHEDHLRMSNAILIANALELVFAGLTPVTFEDIKDLTQATYGDGSDKHQHRATAEILLAMLTITDECTRKVRDQLWEYVFPIVRKIFQDGLTPENLTYWTSFVNSVIVHKDPRRSWPLLDWLASFRLDMDANTAFKESSKISLLNIAISTLGWHFRLEKPILDDFLTHIDHPYKAVREVIGSTLSTILFTRFHESFKNVLTLLEAQRASSSIGIRPYQPPEAYKNAITTSLEKLEVWRKERPAGTQQPTPYTQAAKTVLTWMDTTLIGPESCSIIPFIDGFLIESILHMMDVKEDPELQSLAYSVFRQLPNLPFRKSEDDVFVGALIRIAQTSTFWHQRLRVLINLQVIYFRQLFYMSRERASEILDCVREMLHDVQLEVRLGAAAVISDLIRCSATEFRDQKVAAFKAQFIRELKDNPLVKPAKKSKLLAHAANQAQLSAIEAASTTNSAEGTGSNGSDKLHMSGSVSDRTSMTGTPTPEQNRLVLARHSAVLGLGSLVQAFPFVSPPPVWLPEALATLAGKASADPGIVGKSVKSILSDFKKTRQDTWHVDVKAFTAQQLEDLEGVLWKSYFA